MHRTLKRILRVLCLEGIPDWEKILPQALFALRTVIHDSTGFSPAELVHRNNLMTPVMFLYEKLTEEEPVESSVVDYVFELINRMKRYQELAILHMEDAKQKRRFWYDRRTVKRQFQPGDLVLVKAPSRSNKLSVQWVGPGELVQQLSETNYVVQFQEKDKPHVYHINMLKSYH
ncbi:retrovirus-related Pol polyprotein from transposon 412 [Trichonephila clavipes]|uniref:Retrovirus-related Pol polyprotein from transposon 412 n=1 Tax=Trichonephila clavipes TaxID=2585209 RepID=A0A8X6RYJ3_TRICX|nr:retrovirus-related Pol polyprotein from transposon 412 [Trichonephila clavipes]